MIVEIHWYYHKDFPFLSTQHHDDGKAPDESDIDVTPAMVSQRFCNIGDDGHVVAEMVRTDEETIVESGIGVIVVGVGMKKVVTMMLQLMQLLLMILILLIMLMLLLLMLMMVMITLMMMIYSACEVVTSAAGG